MGEIIFGLEAFGDWEELTLDRKENLVIFSKNSWHDKLFSKNSVKYFFKSKLSDIRHVGVSQNMGLFILPRNGKVVFIGTQGLSRDDVQNIKRDINFFLNLNKTECLENNFLNITESEQYLQTLLQKCNHNDNLKEIFLKNHRKLNLNVPVHQHQSSPLLRDDSKKYTQIFWNKQPYDTDNFQNIHLSHMRRRNSVPRR